jgi:hypothetical protein
MAPLVALWIASAFRSLSYGGQVAALAMTIALPKTN